MPHHPPAADLSRLADNLKELHYWMSVNSSLPAADAQRGGDEHILWHGCANKIFGLIQLVHEDPLHADPAAFGIPSVARLRVLMQEATTKAGQLFGLTFPFGPAFLGDLLSTEVMLRKAATEVALMPTKESPPVESSSPAEARQPRKARGKSVKQAAEELEQLRSQGVLYTTMDDLAERLVCGKTTIHDAIHSSSLLKAWTKEKKLKTAPSAISLTPAKRNGEGHTDLSDTMSPASESLSPDQQMVVDEHIEMLKRNGRKDLLEAFLGMDPQLQFFTANDDYPDEQDEKPKSAYRKA